MDLAIFPAKSCRLRIIDNPDGAANLGDANRAEFELAQALQMDPQNVRVRRRAVLTYEVLKNRSKALQVLRDSPKSLVSDLSHDPSLADLQKDPQFRELLKQ